MKRIISLLLILVLTLGCLGVTASATNPNYPPVKSIKVIRNNIEHEAAVVVSNNVVSYKVRLPGANLANETFTVVLTESDQTSITGVTLNNQTTTPSNHTYTWTNVSLNGSATFQITWANGSGSYSLTAETTPGNAALTGLTIGGVAATAGSITVGGVTRYTYSAILGTNASLTNLAIVPTPTNNTATYKLDGVAVSGTITADFTAQTHTLTVTDGYDTRDYLLSACAPDGDGYITVYLGIRTWAAIDFNNENYSHYDYSTYGSGAFDSDIDDIAISIDTVGAASGTVAAPTWTLDSGSGNYRPVFLTTEYRPVLVEPGDSVMDALVAYASSYGLTLTGVEYSYISDIASNTGSLGYGTCGSGDGWMYLVRYSNTDVATDMPNLAADNYIVTGGQYIDWVFSCAFGDDFGYSIMSW